MQQKRNVLIGIIAIVLLVIFLLRDYLLALGALLVYGVFSLLPVVIFLAFIGFLGYAGYSYFSKSSQVPQSSKSIRTKELSEDLALAFKRNNTRQLQYTLTKLPPWSITPHIQQTAQELVELKRSIYRAQAEGVPGSMIERYLQNMHQAAETVWQLASKVDAVGLQNISYQIVAPRLQQEELKLQQLQQAIKASHEGIALLILSGSTSSLLQAVEEDLHALTAAVKSLEEVHAH